MKDKTMNAKQENETIQDWIENFAQEIGSAVEVWGNEDLWERLNVLVRGGCKIKAVNSHAAAKRLIQQGYVVEAAEENYDQYDCILVKR